MDFIYNLVEEHEGAHGDFSVKEGRPLSGQATFIVTVHFYSCKVLLW